MNILFFGNLREQLGTGQFNYTGSTPNTVGELRLALQQSNPDWQLPLADNNVLFAVNQNMADENTPISANDEIAFFPPVTGG
ncbi:MAG: MoaD/ThiS family protein [Porticoccaceae bacterium]|nr:MoaD/ThiS family protein [Pseudomonadales bacterium]MCP5170742.1 MoaD/ThiS family protein [Pseudomonadales bacterium]MCP5302017.1 MoaD/ThiS family protein [Pseudomonadales bacterium]